MRITRELIRWWLIIGLSLFGLCGTTIAQESEQGAEQSAPAEATEPSQTEAQPETPPDTIAIGEVLTRAEAERARMKEIQDNLDEATVVKSVTESLDKLKESIAKQQQSVANVLERRHTTAELGALREGWRRIESTFATIDKSIADRTNELDQALNDLKSDQELWTRTKDATAESQAPEAVLDQINSVLAELVPALQAIEDARNRLLDLQSQTVDERAQVEEGYQILDEDQEALDADLFQAQEPPLWASKGAYDDFDEDVRRAIWNLKLQLNDLGTYVRTHRDLHVVHVLLIILFGFGLSWGRRQLRRFEGERSPTYDDSLHALSHPWMAGLLVGMLLTAFLHPERVRAFSFALALLSLAPWALIVRAVVPMQLRRWLWPMLALAATDVVRQMSIEIPEVNRVLLMIELGVVGVGCFLLLRRPWLIEAAHQGKAGFWHRLFRHWLRVVILFSVIALGASVLGYSQLGGRIIMPVIWSLYVGAAWFAGAKIIGGLLEAIALSGRLDALNMFKRRQELTLRRARSLIRGGVLFIWFSRVLVMAQLWGPTVTLVDEILNRKLEYGQVSFSLGGVIGFVLTLWVSWGLARFISFAANEELFTRVKLSPGVPYALTTFTRYTILVLGFLVAMAAVGLSIDRIALLVSALGIGIGFGLQAIVNNFVSGVIVLFERPLRVGDLVQIDTLIGEVRDIGIRATKVRTFDGSDVLVPNGDLMASRLVNWTLSDRKRRIAIPVRAHFGTDPDLVLGLLKEAAERHKEVLADPAPDILFMGFGDYGLNFELRAWTESPRGILAVKSDLVQEIDQLLRENNVQIPVPQQEVRFQDGAGAPVNPYAAPKERKGPQNKSGDPGEGSPPDESDE